MSPALLPATEQLALLAKSALSPEELAEEYIRRIEVLNPLLHAYVDFDADRIRAQAACPSPGRLSGLPLSIKASIEVRGWRCEVGSMLKKGETAASDARVVQQLRAEGAVLLGSTNCPEFLMAYETDNLLYPRTNNPWDLTRSAGGSSGGEAACIAAGMSAGGFGSDSGGSVREPAHFTGICSLKPTPGRISAVGHVPQCIGPFSTIGAVGPMARTAKDVALLFSTVCTGPKPYKTMPAEQARGLRVGFLVEDETTRVTAETSAALMAAARELQAYGCDVRPFRSSLLAEARQLWWTFFVQCGAMFYESTVAGRRDELSPIFHDFLMTAEGSPPLTASELLAAWARADTLREQWSDTMREVDILLTPVCAIPAFHHGERSWTIDSSTVSYWEAMQFTQWFNLLACPAAVVPVGRSPEELPIGIQIVGRAFEDESVLAIAAVLDEAFGYRVPPLAT